MNVILLYFVTSEVYLSDCLTASFCFEKKNRLTSVTVHLLFFHWYKNTYLLFNIIHSEASCKKLYIFIFSLHFGGYPSRRPGINGRAWINWMVVCVECSYFISKHWKLNRPNIRKPNCLCKYYIVNIYLYIHTSGFYKLKGLTLSLFPSHLLAISLTLFSHSILEQVVYFLEVSPSFLFSTADEMERIHLKRNARYQSARQACAKNFLRLHYIDPKKCSQCIVPRP